MSAGGSNKDTFGVFGMLLVVGSFVATVGFFLFVVLINPGPLDTGLFNVPVKFSKAQADARATEWKQPTPENLAYGEQLFKVNCAYCHSQSGATPDFSKLGKGKVGGKPLEIYKALKKGFEGHPRYDHIGDREKFALISYVRSFNKTLPDDSSSEWTRFMKEGIN